MKKSSTSWLIRKVSLTSSAQVTVTLATRTFFEDCRQNGYKFAHGGEVPTNTKGYFLPITIIDNPPDESKIVQEERTASFLNNIS